MSGQTIFENERRNWICVLGFANSKKHAPFADERWWIWGVNDLYHYVPRVDVSFEIHHTLNMGGRRNPEHEAVFRGGGRRGSQYAPGQPPTPIFMQEAHPDYPTVIAYPKDKVVSAFGSKYVTEDLNPSEAAVAPGASYFTNSVGWMIALAILELTEVVKVKGREVRIAKEGARLGVVGISMAADSEYIAQRPNVEYWVGKAQGYGIDVWVPDDAHILKAATTYGYATSEPLRIRLQSDVEDFRQKTLQYQQTEAQLLQQLEQVRAELAGIRAVKGYIGMLDRTLTIDTEIAVGSDKKGPGVGRESVLTMHNGQVVETPLVVPSDNQTVEVGV